ncbi:hypothetical protein L226DRAFT_485113 [Lentinus tigrinus ALCF2SS1-7]|uniref:MYND-type domain-containing protein n=1 Tax=Lentinus tigrinus ALCF2SS1-6 TaxID=1328759 RepID=A0A5C2SEW1_9APHY|nr:hypothetical protein L227DRAFT_652459 [Lentinus tigrinus ALCF2SS1-6]RPD76015.1 hypothetical protein L226DRAFT_485113 [Lentinus tigrinus ALCF2SS1-7]
MSCPVYWPTERYFDPIGNTSAVSLTRDLSPEVDADVLLLNCNDCRNVLFTVFCEQPNTERKLDFTCSDVDPAILARALILLTMAIDGTPHEKIWNIFYHIYLDADSLATLVAHCRNLVAATQSVDEWAKSIYSSVVRFGSVFTLSEVHRLLSLYADSDITGPRDGTGEGPVRHRTVEMLEDYDHSSARSAGPMQKYAEGVFQEAHDVYCNTGTTFTEDGDRESAVHQNPTFYHSRHGPDSVVHVCNDPLAPFHTAPIFGNTEPSCVSVADVVGAARREFSVWCRSFRGAAAKIGSLLTVRFLLGDPLAVARTFEYFNRWRTRTAPIPVVPWSAQAIELSAEEYEQDLAPATFNVIDTSTLWDTIGGMFNVLPTVTPILSTSTESDSVLYTESYVRWYDNPKTGLAGYRFELFTETALWIDLCPVDFLGGFSPRFNIEERLPGEIVSRTRRHDVLVWKRPCSGDTIALKHPTPELAFEDHEQLAYLLHEVYYALYGDAEWTRNLRAATDVWHRGLEHPNHFYYTRESFVCLLKCVRERFRLSVPEWNHIMEMFLKFNWEKTEQPMESNEHMCDREFRAQLFLHGIYTSAGMDTPTKPVTGRLSLWSDVPSLVRIYLVVPRAEVGFSLHDTAHRRGTSALAISLEGSNIRGLYQCLRPFFGSVTDEGTEAYPALRLEEDPLGMRGTSDFVVSFVVDTASLCEGEVTPEQTAIEIELFVFTSLEDRAIILPEHPVHRFVIYHTTLEDRTSVFLAPEPFLPSVDYSTDPRTWPCPRIGLSPSLHMPIGEQGVVQLLRIEDEVDGYNANRFRVALTVHNVHIATLLRDHGKDLLKIELVSPHTMRMTLAEADLSQDIIYPLPVMRSKPMSLNLEVASTGQVSIEVIVRAASGALEAEGFMLNATPVGLRGDIICPWDIHRVNLDRMPAVNLRSPKLDQWLQEHLRTQISVMEAMASATGNQYNMYGLKVWRLPKESITTALYRCFSPSAPLNKFGKPFRVVRLCESSELNHPLSPIDTILFMTGLRYDLTAHTVVADAYVLTVAPPLTRSILAPLVQKDALCPVPLFGEELRMWKQLLPALAERCRTWSHGPNCEYKATGRIPLETRLHAGDPLCSCGRGKDVEGLRRVKAWAPFAPHVTRIALSPLFPVWYLEPLMMKFLRRSGGMTSKWTLKKTIEMPPKCIVCDRAMYDLKKCARCQKDTYCSEKCQRQDWSRHKKNCIGLIKQ